MPDDKAKEIIALRDREKANQGTFRSLWQSVSDLMFPQTVGIETTRYPGEELMNNLFDTTAVEELDNMTSGLVTNLFPPGQQFFAIELSGDGDDYEAKRYLAYATERTHGAMFDSNLIPQVSNTIKYWAAFGTGSLYSDWTPGTGLNYRDYAIGTYQCLENDRGVIDTIIMTCPRTARQLVQQFGINKVGDSIRQAYDIPEKRETKFNLIHVIRPRAEFDENPILRPAIRAPFESVFVNEKDQTVLEESGFDEFPFAVPRYDVIYGETYGRGRGTMLLPKVRVLNRLNKSYLDMANKWVAPPLEVLESFEGQVDLTPLAQNFVVEHETIRPINMGANGMYPVTKDILEYYREGVRQGFFKNAFEPVGNLTGDRRTTTEIVERLKEGFKRQAKPMGRLFDELLTPLVYRSYMLLVRNGVIPRPPQSLWGRPFKITFINPLALALRDQQSKGLQYWVSAGIQMAEAFPGVLDNVDGDKAYRDLGLAIGVKTDHIRPIRERDAIREQRAERQQAMEQLQAAQAMAEGYGKTTKAPEEGSPAEALLGAAS